MSYSSKEFQYWGMHTVNLRKEVRVPREGERVCTTVVDWKLGSDFVPAFRSTQAYLALYSGVDAVRYKWNDCVLLVTRSMTLETALKIYNGGTVDTRAKHTNIDPKKRRRGLNL